MSRRFVLEWVSISGWTFGESVAASSLTLHHELCSSPLKLISCSYFFGPDGVKVLPARNTKATGIDGFVVRLSNKHVSPCRKMLVNEFYEQDTMNLLYQVVTLNLTYSSRESEAIPFQSV
jgi:hypothetical protein